MNFPAVAVLMLIIFELFWELKLGQLTQASQITTHTLTLS